MIQLNFCNWMKKKIKELLTKFGHSLFIKITEVNDYEVERISTSKALIRKRRESVFMGSEFLVDLNLSTCTCGKFQDFKFPCIHAMSFIEESGRDIYRFIDHFYYREYYKFSKTFEIIPPLSSEIVENDIEPPNNLVRRGRPRVSRNQSAGESESLRAQRQRRTYKCTLCSTFGHNKRRCPLRNTSNP